MRILVFSDVHLDITRRIEDTVASLDFLRQEAISRKVDGIWILGDVYTSRRPHTKEKSAFQKWVKSILDVGISLTLLRGNHDEYPDGTHSYEELEIFKLPVSVVRGPYVYGDVYLDHTLLIGSQLGNSGYRSETGDNLRNIVNNNPDCKAFLFGDVHKFQIMRKTPLCMYCGSVAKVDFSEYRDTKFCHVVTMREKKFESIEHVRSRS